jgi:uncharacterized protein with PQ loop repeat
MVELQEIGWNAVTLSFIATFVTLVIGLWGLWKQNRTIWRMRSGESVSVIMYSYTTAFFIAAAVYGLQTGSLALTANLFRLLLLVPIMVGLLKFKKFRPWEKVLSVLFIGITVAMLLLPHKDWLFLALCVCSWVSIVTQAVEILHKGEIGAVDVRMLWTMLVTASAWLVYGFAVHDWVLMATNPIYAAIVAITVAIWYVVRRKSATAGGEDD